ncbi:cytochrome c3 family protein [Breoghania sp. L-A4]|uniref:cytochrome c3 family protein n=1 Tax=Breoghania sp. L-A4 TaxID=2304600 RepID=UPI0013C29EA2|nr:cytochrome c3 family protein [Breoghania sp. L-A4]
MGRCTKCHSVDDEDGRKHVKWRGFSTGRVSGRFTRFSHEPHVSAVGPQGCIACHALTETAPASQGNAFLKTYLGGDPAAFVPNFKNPDKALCATCHTESKAGESCTLCHSYHTTDLDRPMSGTRLPK